MCLIGASGGLVLGHRPQLDPPDVDKLPKKSADITSGDDAVA